MTNEERGQAITYKPPEDNHQVVNVDRKPQRAVNFLRTSQQGHESIQASRKCLGKREGISGSRKVPWAIGCDSQVAPKEDLGSPKKYQGRSRGV
jgi:hypothetical protein